MENAPVSFQRKHPIILPSKHHVTNLVIQNCHRQHGQCCPSQVLTFFRRRFWIVRGLSAVRNVLSNCMNCREQNARPGKQIMDPLPSARVAPTDPPFTHVGVDHFSSPLFEARTPSGKTLRMFVHMPNHEDSGHGSRTHFGSRLVYLCVSAFCQPQREAHRDIQ